MKNFFSISLVNTKQCNLNCTYCYEKGKFENKEFTKESINKIIKFIKNLKKWYNADFEITLIGGEPTLAKENPYLFRQIKKLIEEGINIQIRIITNSYSYNKIVNIFDKHDLEFFKPRTIVQVSYDGKVINDKYRLKKLGNSFLTTSDKVKENIYKLMKNKFKTSIKPTLVIDDMKLVPEVLKEFREMNKELKKLPGYSFINYSVTEDKDSIINKTEEEIKNILKESMKEIIDEERINLAVLKQPLSRWFTDYTFNEITTCTAGYKLFSINTDLDLQFCHHVDYLKKFPNKLNYEKIYNLTKEKLDFIIKQNTTFSKNFNCIECSAIYCTKCPVYNYDLQLKNNSENLKSIYHKFENDKICFYYQELSKYIYYFIKKYL